LQTIEKQDPRFFYGYVIVVLVFVVMLLSWGIFLSFGVFFEPMLEEFGWTRAMTSGAYSIAFLVMGPFGLGVGRLTDRYGPRVVISGCGLLLGTGLLLMTRISALWQLYLVYGVIIGIGMSATWVPANSIVPRWFVKRRGLMTGIVLNGNGMGTLIIPPIAGWLIATYGWRLAYGVTGMAAFVLIILAAQFLKAEPAKVGQLPYGADNEAESVVMNNGGYSLKEAIHTMQLWLLSGVSFCLWLVIGVIMVHIVIHATGMGMPASSATRILVLIGGASIVGRAAMGGFSDMIGNRKALMLSFAIMAASIVWLMISGNSWMLYLFGIVFGFSYGSLSPLVSPAVAELFGLSSHGAIFAVTFLWGTIGEAIGPFVAGWIFDLTSSYQGAFLICLAISVMGVILSSILGPIRRCSAG